MGLTMQYKTKGGALSCLPTTTISNFAFNTQQGGTGLSNWDHNERFDSTASARVIKGWYDYETGFRFVGISTDARLDAYLDRVAGTDRRVFFGQFDLPQTDDATARQLMLQLAEVAGQAKTSDGYTFVRQSDGTWGDGDMSFPSAASLMDELGAAFDASDLFDNLHST